MEIIVATTVTPRDTSRVVWVFRDCKYSANVVDLVWAIIVKHQL